MPVKQFTIQLILYSLLSFVLLMGFHHFVDSSQPNFSWLSLAFFILFSALMYFFGWQTSTSSDRNAFTRTVIGFMALKMFFSVILVATYVKLNEPDSKFFLIPFIIVYLVFTSFETYFMSRLGKRKPVVGQTNASLTKDE